jgi:membrane-bound lytic murein transglycosylase B
VHIGGGAALEAVRRRAAQFMRTPAFGIAAITPLVFAGAVGASPESTTPVRDAAVTPLAAVASAPNRDGASIVAVTKNTTPFHIASTANISGPPPAVVVSSPGALRIPMIALNAYQNAERMMASAYPSCGISWNLLAGIGRIESMHANGGATDASGSAVRPIYGPALDGSLPGNETIELSRSSGRVTYARAMGPMQFLPGTWSRYASDGNGDGKADVQNVFDASLAAARYLCSGGLNLRDQSQVMTAILRYNNSVAYAQNVLGWAAAYATGVVPVDLPPITGPIPPLADSHLDNYQGLGPGLPMNALGLPADDPMAMVPLVNMGRTDVASQMFGPLPGPPPDATMPGLTPGAAQGMPPGMEPPQQNCAVFCLGTNPPAAVQPQLPPEALPPGIVPPPAGPPELAPPGLAPPGFAPPGLAPPGFAPPGLAPPGLAPPSSDGPQEPAPPLLGPQGAGPAPGPASPPA